jgi:hypothetical protein
VHTFLGGWCSGAAPDEVWETVTENLRRILLHLPSSPFVPGELVSCTIKVPLHHPAKGVRTVLLLCRVRIIVAVLRPQHACCRVDIIGYPNLRSRRLNKRCWASSRYPAFRADAGGRAAGGIY